MSYSNTYTDKKLMTHAELIELIETARDKKSKPLQNNTRAELRDNGNVAIKLHDTDVVTVSPDNVYTLNSGGWQTVTTKDRINAYAPVSITQRNYIWYMGDGSLFYDGMEVKANGEIVKPKKPGNSERQLNKLKKQAKDYAKKYAQAIKDGEVGYPSSGDCWGCYFGLNNSKDDPNPMGTDHLLQHMIEDYFVPSLVVNAGRSAGYRDDQMGMMGLGGRRVFIDPENVIYKFIVKSLRSEVQS